MKNGLNFVYYNALKLRASLKYITSPFKNICMSYNTCNRLFFNLLFICLRSKHSSWMGSG